MAVTAWYINITVDTISIIPFRITKPLGIVNGFMFDYHKVFLMADIFYTFLLNNQ